MHNTSTNKVYLLSKKMEHKVFKEFWRDRHLLIMLIPMVVFLIIFSYIPMYGILIAFQNYQIGDKFVSFHGETDWVGFENFVKFFNSIFFERVIKNTLLITFLSLIFGFWVPIVFALLLNEIRHKNFKKFSQTLSYLPHFISTVIIVGIVVNMLAFSDGVINNFIEYLGGERIQFLNESQYFRSIYITMGIWQSFGWTSIIYMAAIAGIDPEQYDAARIDGGNRLQQAIHITLPGMMPTIVLLLLLNIGSLLSVDFEKILLLYSPATYDVADVIGTYTYRTGLLDSQFSYATAIGFFSTTVNFLFLIIANKVSRKLVETSLW